MMGSLNNIFGIVFGINLVIVGAVAVVLGVVTLAKKDGSVKKMTSAAYIVAGGTAFYIGLALTRSSF